jgi:peptide/nickel transport system substrate-binding protein
MKSTLFRRGLSLAAASALAFTGIAGISSSANAATKTTLIIGDGLGWSSLNTSNPDENSTINADVAYLTGAGFWYYDNKPSLVANPSFGTYAIVKSAPKDFEVKYTVKKGQVWSDGTPIDAVDLLLSHVIASSKYSIKAGLGDPSSDAGSKFYSGGYGGGYDLHVLGNPVISSDHMSLTIKFDQAMPNWKVETPGASPVHTLELMKDGKTTLQSAAANLAAKAKFLSDYTNAYKGNAAAQARMSAIGTIWTNDYNFDSSSYDRAAKPLIAVGNGAYSLKSYNSSTQTVTLDLNPKFNSGHKVSAAKPVKTIVFKYVADGTASVQALQNGDINLYQGAPGAAGYSTLQTLKQAKSIGLLGGVSATYEHIDLRTGNGPGTSDDYNGLFADSHGQKAKDLRLAFLLAFPRKAIVDTQLKPFNAKGALLNSNFTLNGSARYATITKLNGLVSKHTVTIGGVSYSYNFNVTTDAQQAANEALALKLVKKYYANAGDGVDTAALHVHLLRSSRLMRVQNNALIVAHEAHAGFTVSNETTANWSSRLSENAFDAEEFAWVPNSITQNGSNANYLSDGGNNHTGWFDEALDAKLHLLDKTQSESAIQTISGQAEGMITGHAWTLPIFQWAQVTAYSTGVYGVKPGPISPTYAWNYWEWHF